MEGFAGEEHLARLSKTAVGLGAGRWALRQPAGAPCSRPLHPRRRDEPNQLRQPQGQGSGPNLAPRGGLPQTAPPSAQPSAWSHSISELHNSYSQGVLGLPIAVSFCFLYKEASALVSDLRHHCPYNQF
jgi:hypothetical protein